VGVKYVDIEYPRLNPDQAVVDISLVDVRAARNIRVHYDFDRDGYVISAPNNPGDPDSPQHVEDEVWSEVAFVPAWDE
jgi:hypothetical protein